MEAIALDGQTLAAEGMAEFLKFESFYAHFFMACFVGVGVAIGLPVLFFFWKFQER